MSHETVEDIKLTQERS